MLSIPPDADVFDRMVIAVERIRDRIQRTATALDAAAIPYALVGSSAVAAWIASIDESAVRNTRDVDILLRGSDLEAATTALRDVGLFRSEMFGKLTLLDGPSAKPRDAVQIVIANEILASEPALTAPDPAHSVRLLAKTVSVLSLGTLVEMTLATHRLNDRVDLRDLIDVGLVDQTWPARLPPLLANRLQHLIDTRES